MTTKTDITLPPLPVGFFKHRIAGFDGPVYAEMQMEAYARAAVEADRRAQMSDNVACIANLSESDKQDQSADLAGVVGQPADDRAAYESGRRVGLDFAHSVVSEILRKHYYGSGIDGLNKLVQQAADVIAREKDNPTTATTDYGQPAASAEPNAHTDDDAVDHFAAAMKEKLAQARAKGRHGWHECAPADLSAMLRAHVEKGDPRDVANFCMFLWSLGQPISAAPVAQEPVLRIYAEGSRRAVTEWLDGARDLPDGDHILFAAPVAAQTQPQQSENQEALADTQRAIIEAAERRGYARAEAENVGYRTDAERYRWLKENIELGYELPGGYYIPDEDTDTWDKTIDAARAAKGE